MVDGGCQRKPGASAEIVTLAMRGRVRVLVNVPLFLEYEAQYTKPEHLRAAGFSADQAIAVLDDLARLVEPVPGYFQWRPQLRDPGDEMVLEAAVNGRADALVTFNHRDYGEAPARFGIALLRPMDFLRSI